MMTNSNYHSMTFLRTALAKDPFCLGDLGPEDVLRIESYFPELFTPCSSLEKPFSDNKIKTKKLSSPLNISKTNIKDTIPSTSSHVFVPSSKKSLSSTFTCSRGSRCGGTTNTNNLQVLPKCITKAGMKPIKKLPLVGVKSEVVKLTPKKSSIAQVEKLNLNKKVTMSEQNKNLILRKEKGPIKSSFTREVDRSGDYPSGVTLLSLSPIKDRTKRNSKPNKSNIRLQSQSKSVPMFSSTKKHNSSIESKISTTQGTLQRQQLIKNLQNIISSFVQLPDFESEKVVLPTHPLKQGPGFIRPLPKNPMMNKNLKSVSKNNSKIKHTSTKNTQAPVSTTKVEEEKINENMIHSVSPPVEEVSINQENLLINSDDANDSYSQCLDESVIISSDPSSPFKPKLPSPTKIQKPKESEIISENITREIHLQNSSVDRVEQLILAKVLASRYEKDGKFNKLGVNSKTKKQTLDKTEMIKQIQSNYNINIVPAAARTEMLEKIAENLIRAEILKCIHNEELYSTKVDIGIGTNTSPWDHNEQLLDSRLTPINEEVSEALVTPDLTPPQFIKLKTNLNIHEFNNEISEDITVSTPKQTLEKPIIIKEKIINSKKPSKISNQNDTTDCSSLSDFVVSEPAVNYKIFKKNLNSKKEIQISEVKTPELTISNSSEFVGDDIDLIMESVVKTPVPTRSNSSIKQLSVEEFNVHFVPSPKSQDLGLLLQTPERSPSKSKSKTSFADMLSEFEKSVTSGFQKLFTEILSDGEFLGTPYKSPGELSLSMSSVSPGLYLSEDDTEDISLTDMDTITDDTTTTTKTSHGEHRSWY